MDKANRTVVFNRKEEFREPSETSLHSDMCVPVFTSLLKELFHFPLIFAKMAGAPTACGGRGRGGRGPEFPLAGGLEPTTNMHVCHAGDPELRLLSTS